MLVQLFHYNISWQLAQRFAVIADTPTGMAKVTNAFLHVSVAKAPKSFKLRSNMEIQIIRYD
jgi:hypothetical protein